VCVCVCVCCTVGANLHLILAILKELRNEIQRLEEVDLGLDDLEKEDSNYILLDK